MLRHPAATVALMSSSGRAPSSRPGARVTANSRLGRHVHVNMNTTIGHDSVIADFVTIFVAPPSVVAVGSMRV